MLDHHQRTIDKAVAALQQEPAMIAVIVGGSVAKGVARPDSDVDLYLVTTPDEYARRRREKAYTLLSYEFHDYEGGYVDAKYIDVPFLEAAAERGSEPTRDSFTGAYTVWSRIEGLDNLIRRIPVYPKQEREGKMRAFYSQALIQLYFLKVSDGAGDGLHYLRARSASTMALFGSRLLLAYHRVLFPSHRRLIERVASLPRVPDGYFLLLERLLSAPSSETGRAFMDALSAFHDWGIDWDTALGQFTEDAEFNWLDGKPPLADS